MSTIVTERMLRFAGKYKVKITCDLGGPYTVKDEKDIQAVEKWFSDRVDEKSWLLRDKGAVSR